MYDPPLRPAQSSDAYPGSSNVDFEDLVTTLAPPPKRVGKTDGPHEHHLYEGAVMVAYAMHLLRAEGVASVRIHPAGEHGKRFDFAGWLARRDFVKVSSLGSTTYGYASCGRDASVT